MTNGVMFFVCSTSAISALSAAPRNFSLFSCTERMAQRMLEQSEENRIAGTLVATDMDQNSVNLQEESVSTETCGNGDDRTPRTFRKIQNSRRFRRFQNLKNEFGHIHFRISPDCVLHMEKADGDNSGFYDQLGAGYVERIASAV